MVERLTLGEFDEDDGGEQVGAKKTTSRRIVGRRRLADAAAFDDDALAFDILWPVLTHRPLADEGTHGLGLGGRRLRCELVLRGIDDQLFELQLHLIDQPLGALTARTVFVTFLLGDQQLKMGVECLDTGKFCLGICCFRLEVQGLFARAYVNGALQIGLATIGSVSQSGTCCGPISRLAAKNPLVEDFEVDILASRWLNVLTYSVPW